MTHNEKNLVQATFAEVAPIADVAAELFYGRLFEIDPTLKPMFRGDLKEQGRKLMQMLAFAVGGLRSYRRFGLWAAGMRGTVCGTNTTTRSRARCCGRWKRGWETGSRQK